MSVLGTLEEVGSVVEGGWKFSPGRMLFLHLCPHIFGVRAVCFVRLAEKLDDCQDVIRRVMLMQVTFIIIRSPRFRISFLIYTSSLSDS